MTDTAQLDAHQRFIDVCSAVWDHRVECNPSLARLAGVRMRRLPEVSNEAAEARSSFMARQLGRLRGLSRTALSYREQLIAMTLEWDLERTVEEVDSWWHLFPVAPYTSPLSDTLQILSALPLDREERCDDYWCLCSQIPALLDDIAARVVLRHF